MDIATIIGLLSGTTLVVVSVLLGGSPLVFFNIPSLLIVVGGTAATVFIKFSMSDVINTMKVAMKAFLYKMEPPEKTIQNMVALAKTAKKEGLIALENQKVEDTFAAKALRYLSDGFDEGLIEDMLMKDISLMDQRHVVGQKIFKGMGASAPAFGMIGTLIGLVQMLSSMDDPASIGPSMAVALLTTLYGAVIANLICMPLADKLALRSEREQRNKQIILEAAIAMNKGLSPMVLEESLKIYLSPTDRKKFSPEEKSE
ncbi:MAG: MotA/TolQ/ExbB proton channel family protein [Desulfococcaceae bacterium]|jgi:chemotaxis protein MotA|nr:MotA/TolQ/ExbB proton channel family protein [Desulfococcaceae bacterium]